MPEGLLARILLDRPLGHRAARGGQRVEVPLDDALFPTGCVRGRRNLLVGADQGWLAARVLVGMLGAEEGEREGEEGRKKTMLEEVR